MRSRHICRVTAAILALSMFATMFCGCTKKKTVTMLETELVGPEKGTASVVNTTYEEGKTLKSITGEMLDVTDERFVPLVGFGFGMMIPEAWGTLEYFNFVAVENGIVYTFMPRSAYTQLMELGEDADDDAIAEVYQKQLNFVKIFYLEDELAGIGAKEELQTYANVERLGSLNGNTYYIAYNDKLTDKDLDIVSTDEDKAAFETCAAAIAELKKNIVIFPIQKLKTEESVTDAALEGFRGMDLDGNAMDLSMFTDYDLTMINLWATWCGPCVSELPDLSSLYDSLPANVNLVTVCQDGDTEGEAAQEFLKECGAKFRTLAADDVVRESRLKDVYSYPTTIFVDRDGKIIGEPIYGSWDEAFYRNEIEARLAGTER